MPLRPRTTRPLSPLLAAIALAFAALAGCVPWELARDCEGTGDRVKEVAALGILGSRPEGAAFARGFEEMDAGCWADSGDVVVYAERTYTFPGTRAEVAAHYRTAAVRDGWKPDSEAPPGDLRFTRDGMALSVAFLTAEGLAEAGLGSRPDLTAGAAYAVGVDAYVPGGATAG
ncbi:hypothetical protein ACF1BN_02905 [Streptomyces sp. NPDC014861]|uniref:hypothetical protein n=1 Tax=Streptomyces sp. NPDC014861 TaxID=3364923 RepID=UPI0036FFB6ED